MRQEEVLESVRELGVCSTGDVVRHLYGIEPGDWEWKKKRMVTQQRMVQLQKFGLVCCVGIRQLKYTKEKLWMVDE